MLFTGFKRILVEDFDSKNRDLVTKLAYPINQAMEFLARLVNKNITFDDNINCQVKTIDITVDSDGKPKQSTIFKSDLKSSSKGMFVIRADNLTNSSVYPTSAPFITFSETSGQISILHVTGLPADNKFQLKLISLG